MTPVPRRVQRCMRRTLPPLLILALLPSLAAATQVPDPFGAYAWLPRPAERSTLVPLSERFPTPEGLTRVPQAPGSFGAWLRGLPVRVDRSHVLAYDGRPLVRPSVAIIALDVGERDLQQCADTALRLHAEWLWQRGEADRAAYHFTSGDRSAWKDWRRGERFRVRGAKVERVRGRATANSHAAYRGWLTHLFRYAGTQSLRHDSKPVGARALEPGDVFVQPGGPGHAVVLLDVATGPDGARYGLVGQGFMPAEDLHVVGRTGDDVVNGVWFRLPDKAGDLLDTPSWRPFRRSDAIRFR